MFRKKQSAEVLIRGIRELLMLSLIAAILSLICSEWQKRSPREESLASGEISPEATARIPSRSLLFVDVRPLNEFERGHPPGAVPLNNADWDTLVGAVYDAWEPGKSIIVYGRARSDEPAAIAHRLRVESGIENIYALRGIWEECR